MVHFSGTKSLTLTFKQAQHQALTVNLRPLTMTCAKRVHTDVVPAHPQTWHHFPVKGHARFGSGSQKIPDLPRKQNELLAKPGRPAVSNLKPHDSRSGVKYGQIIFWRGPARRTWILLLLTLSPIIMNHGSGKSTWNERKLILETSHFPLNITEQWLWEKG